MSKDETSSIVNLTGNTVKVQGIFTVLENDALTKGVQLPKALSKTTHFFHRGKPKNDGRRTYANIRILHSEDMQNTMCYLRYYLENKETSLGLQQVQHHDMVKIGCILRMMDKTRLQECTYRLKKILFTLLN